MKSKGMNFLLKSFIFLLIFISVFLFSFSLSFYFSHNYFLEPTETVKLKGAKNLLQSIDIIHPTENESDIETEAAGIEGYKEGDSEKTNYVKTP
ncbi:hypothetical protein J2Z35_002332 [Acetoanaerobium pronyense]|uniref:Uncharacterized protein n=1 Tax=Acetoanaerobium pronyense TaxID=1482736 RepID=A0ABS4KL56_9FIRM|nr:hypothetical protein [Acetoanaerobium pronyense]MBP2028507.1 hypothetical protein [Acetoanaerobium pronyense]